jgi:TPR repeat protein
LDIKHLPLTTEEKNEFIFKTLYESQGIPRKNINLEKIKKMIEKMDPTKKDVFLGHEYRDGSNKLKQNYEMAAKYYSKAAFQKIAEGLYNPALLHMKGHGVKMDFQTAVGLLKQAASQADTIMNGKNKIPNVGVKEAEHSLALAHEQGTYVDKNITMSS